MNNLSNLKGKLLVEQIEDQIFELIIKTPIPVGQKLPNEFGLGERFGVSRSTVREAVRSLTSKGILEVRRGSGTYVASTTPIEEDPLKIRSFADKEAIALDLVEVRLMIEPAMAEMAAMRATEEQITQILALCDAVEKKAEEGLNYINEDIAFHCYIAECSGNKIIEQLIPIIDTAVMMFVNVTHKKLLHETIFTHRAVAEAIAEHDATGAKTAMTMHMAYNRDMIKKVLKQRDFKENQ